MKFLKPLSSKIKTFPIWGFDIETEGDLNKFVMASIYGDFGINKIFWDKKDFVNFVKKKCEHIFSKGYIAATNLQFDILGILDKTDTIKDIDPLIRNSNFLQLKIPCRNGLSLKFIDTSNFAPFSVKKWGEILNIPKLPHPKCFGRRPKNYFERKELEIYNLRDSEISYEAMKFLQSGFNDSGGRLKITISSTSLDIYRRCFMKGIYYQPKRNEIKYIYNGYKGARTEIIKRGLAKNINYYDVNSLYPSVMLRKYPHPNHFKFSKYINLKTIYEYEGICYCEVKAPDMYIPYLPFRQEKPTKKLLFPYGTFKGHYTFYELRKAIDLGYEIKRFYSGIVYFKTFYPFRDFMLENYEKRKEQKKKNNPCEIVTKLVMNSLYGKFGQKIDENDKIFHESKITMDIIEKNSYIERNGEWVTLKRPCHHIANFVNPIFCAYTTAYARDVLYNLLKRCKKDIYYCDTDSVMTKCELPESLELGKLKKEFFVRKAILIKPKMYLIDDKVKCKGLGFMTPQEFDILLQEKKRMVTRFAKFKECNKRNISYNQKINFYKYLDLEDNKRIWEKPFDRYELQDSRAIVL